MGADEKGFAMNTSDVKTIILGLMLIVFFVASCVGYCCKREVELEKFKTQHNVK